MQLDDHFEIGYILKPHGLNGAVNIRMDADDPIKYKGMESVIVKIGNNLVPFLISSLKINGEKGILQLQDVNSKEDADELNSCPLLLPIEQLPKLSGNQFYYHDVIGYKIVDQGKEDLGIIEHIFTEGNQDLISMKYKEKEVLIPITNEIVIRADHSKKVVYVKLPEGILEIYL
jgi:16S rRNA processing protein RimM